MAFLLSAERSGSTLLSMTMGSNPTIVAPPELHLLAYESFDEWQTNYPEAMDSLRHVFRANGQDIDHATIARIFHGRTTIEVYRWLLLNVVPTDRTLLDKTPRYARSADSLARIETLQPHYIWLVRHPLAVAMSQMELRDSRSGGSAPGLVERLRRIGRSVERRLTLRRSLQVEVDYWRSVNRNIELFLAGIDPARQIRVNFETFVKEPESLLGQLSSWLGTSFVDEMLAPGTHLPDGLGTKTGDPKIHRTKGIEAAAADRWRASCPERWLDPITRTHAERWGVTVQS